MKTLIIATILGLAATLLITGLAVGGDNVKITNIIGKLGESAQQSSTPAIGEEVNWQVISSGGENNGASVNFIMSGTVGQTATGSSNSANYGLSQGFWQDFADGSSSSCIPGDADGSGAVDIDDVVYLIAYIFSGGPEPTPAVCCGDADGSGGVDIDDVVYLIAYIFSGGPAPADAC